MKKTEIPPLAPRVTRLLEKLNATLIKAQSIAGSDPEYQDKLREVREEIDDLSVKILRGGGMISRPPEERYPGFRLVFDSEGKTAKLVHGAGDFHPEIPARVENHFVEWIQMQNLRDDGRETLRRAGVAGLETGIKRPRDLRLFVRVLELRGVEEKSEPDGEDVPISESLGEMLDRRLDDLLNKLRGLDEIRDKLKSDEKYYEDYRHEMMVEKKRKRTKKDRRPWHWVIKKLVEEGIVKKVKAPSGQTKNPSLQAFKKMLKRRYPLYSWDKV